VRTLIVLLLLCGTCTAAPVSSDYTCVRGHEQEATNKLQAYITAAIIKFFRSRRIAINLSTLQVNVGLTIQTGADTKPYVAFAGSAGFAANSGAGAAGTPGVAAAIPGAPRAAGAPGAAANPGGVVAANPGGAVAANPPGGANGYGGGGVGSAPAATVTAKDGTQFDVLFSSGSDTQDAGEYRILASQRGFTREGNPIGRHCRLRLFESGDFDATRSLLVINASSGHALGLIRLPAEIWVY
jgi:hypothetical protein